MSSRLLFSSPMPLLESAPMLRSRDFEETRAYLAAKEIGYQMLGRSGADAVPDVHLNGIYLADTWLGYIRYGMSAQVELSPLSSVWRARDDDRASAAPTNGDYWVHVPMRGCLQAKMQGRVIECDRSRGVVVSPSQSQTLRTSA